MRREPSRRQLLRYAGATAAASVGLAGASSATARHGTDPHEEVPFVVQAVDKFDWEPVVLPIPTGATVTFLSNMYPHSVTSSATVQDALNCDHNGDWETNTKSPATVDSADEPFNLPLPSSQSVQITFNAAGEFPYFCEPHCGQKMVGAVIVRGP